MARKPIDLRDKQKVMELMKSLHPSNNNPEVKDDQTIINSKRSTRAKVACKVVEPSSCLKRPVLQE